MSLVGVTPLASLMLWAAGSKHKLDNDDLEDTKSKGGEEVNPLRVMVVTRRSLDLEDPESMRAASSHAHCGQVFDQAGKDFSDSFPCYSRKSHNMKQELIRCLVQE